MSNDTRAILVAVSPNVVALMMLDISCDASLRTSGMLPVASIIRMMSLERSVKRVGKKKVRSDLGTILVAVWPKVVELMMADISCEVSLRTSGILPAASMLRMMSLERSVRKVSITEVRN